MKEEFLQFIWLHKLYFPGPHHTPDGKKFEILNPGIPNTDAGPDFFNAKIKIDKTVWAGNIEIHGNSSDWNHHGHQNDKKYDNVILHVVANFDSEVTYTTGKEVLTWEMKFDDRLLQKYFQLKNKAPWIACSGSIHKIPPIEIGLWLDRLLVEKLEKKHQQTLNSLKEVNHDWDEVFFRGLARAFGFGKNSIPFELLAKSLSIKTLLKHSHSIVQTESLLFGQAGFLSNTKGDEYYQKLKQEFEFLAKKYQLTPIENHLWKFLRLRPSNFPTVRIAQLAAFLCKTKGSFGEILHLEGATPYAHLDFKISEYWNNHYHFDRFTKKEAPKTFGKTSQNLIIINAIIPFLFSYATYRNDAMLKEKALNWYQKIPAEKNSILDGWKKIDIFAYHATESQALVYLKNNYCNFRNCLKCQLGRKILFSEASSIQQSTTNKSKKRNQWKKNSQHIIQ